MLGLCREVSGFGLSNGTRKFPGCVWKLWSYKNIIFAFYHMTQQISRLLNVSGVYPEVILNDTKFSGLIINFRIAMLLCYQVFSFSGREIQCLLYVGFFSRTWMSEKRPQALVRFDSIPCDFFFTFPNHCTSLRVVYSTKWKKIVHVAQVKNMIYNIVAPIKQKSGKWKPKK